MGRPATKTDLISAANENYEEIIIYHLFNMNLKYNNWNDISVKKYDEIRKSLIRNKNNELEANLELLSILCDVPVDEIEDLPLNEFSRLLKQTDFIAKMPKIDIKEKYVINGKKYNVCFNVKFVVKFLIVIHVHKQVKHVFHVIQIMY